MNPYQLQLRRIAKMALEAMEETTEDRRKLKLDQLRTLIEKTTPKLIAESMPEKE